MAEEKNRRNDRQDAGKEVTNFFRVGIFHALTRKEPLSCSLLLFQSRGDLAFRITLLEKIIFNVRRFEIAVKKVDNLLVDVAFAVFHRDAGLEDFVVRHVISQDSKKSINS